MKSIFPKPQKKGRAMVQPQRDHDDEQTNVVDLESEITDLVRNRVTPLPPLASPVEQQQPLPDYVAPAANVPEVGRLVAEAIVRDYEATAQKYNDMSSEIGKTIKRCDGYLTELHAARTHFDELAKRCRERGAEIFHNIEQSSLITAEVRKAADEMMTKLAASPVAADPPQI